MLCNKIAEVQNGQMLLMQPSNRIIEEEDSPEQWPPETSDNMDGQIDFDMGINLGSMDGQIGFSEQAAYLEESAVPDFGEDAERDDLSPQSSISSNNNLPLRMPPSSSSSQQQRQQFLAYTTWGVQDPSNMLPTPSGGFDRTREADIYSQLQQNLNGAFGIGNPDEVDGLDRFTSPTDIWAASTMGLGGGPEAVEQWN